MRNDGNRTPRASRIALGAALCAALACGTASAVTLEQAPIDGGDAYLSSIEAGNQNLDNFLVTTESTLQSVTWWGNRTPPISPAGDDLFEIRVFAQIAGAPAAVDPVLLLPATVTGQSTGIFDAVGDEVLKYTVDVPAGTPNLLLPATYYLAVTARSGQWFWLLGEDGDGLNWYRFADDEPWIPAGSGEEFDFAFSLELEPQAIPEPGSIALLAFGASGLVALARRRVAGTRSAMVAEGR